MKNSIREYENKVSLTRQPNYTKSQGKDMREFENTISSSIRLCFVLSSPVLIVM